ncbi:M42 family metallopeptidase [Halorussus litoreus]|uniref:M42 family metallopeptidase n=1 Tax=Halorussus litoreus TaxID=1710536 RepID=UPI000E26AA27|nr:M42 family metallopeptidase [Halorussus litoreus]
MDFDLLCELTETSGVPGYEDRVRDLVRRELDGVVDSLRTDAMGNVVGTVEGSTDYEVAIAAHMDEIGFMVKHVTDEGFLEIDALGGWDPDVLRAQRVTVHTESEDLTGVIGSIPTHVRSDDDEEYSVEDVTIDLGLPAEEVEQRVSVGDLVSTDQTTVRMGDQITGKALDDRVCLLAMLAAAERVEDPEVTVHFCATVQEELGVRGAPAVGADLDPDLAVALDVTVANDIPAVDDEGKYVTRLGDGAAIKVKDSSVVTTPKVYRRMAALADERDIDHQMEVLPSGATDTSGFQNTRRARPVGAISIPTRYLHTTTETAHCDDVEAATDLLTAFLETEDGQHDYSL